MKHFEVSKMKFTFPHGKHIQAEEVHGGKFEWVGVGYAPESDVAYVFETRDHFVKWSQGNEFEEKVARLFHGIDQAKRAEKTDNTIAIRRQKALTKRITDELAELSERTGLPIGSEELLLRASHFPHGVEGPIFDSAVLYNSPRVFGPGSWLPISAGWWYPDLSWLGFDNLISSGWYLGNVILCTGSWYTGMGISFQTIYLGGDTFSFAGSGWDNTISSAAALY
jgi:hypothetical protein